MSLVPRTLVGKATARDFSPVHYSDASGSRDIVNSAFNSQAPVIESGLAGNETRLAAAIGDEQRAGVFYLECPTEGRLSDPLLVFKALRKTLIDCLNLR